MGDSVRMQVTETWTAIPGLTLALRYAFQNVSQESMFLKQQGTLPLSTETGNELLPYKSADLTKEANEIYVRMRTGIGFAYYNEFIN